MLAYAVSVEPWERIAELEGQLAVVMAAWAAERAELQARIAQVEGKVAELEKLLGRNSSNSSKPPSSDAGSAKSARAENANRKARRAMGRSQGKQPGTPGHTLSQIADPDAVVLHRPDRCRSCERCLDGAVVLGGASGVRCARPESRRDRASGPAAPL
ncbi:MAG: DUF6444 domain-containing protein [Gemmatimonadota bacterium]|nr:DUF6444 domain-containing protein [Gemmatimonadota bacterium]